MHARRGCPSRLQLLPRANRGVHAAIDADVVGLIGIENDDSGRTSTVHDLVNGLNGVLGAGT